MVIELSAGNFIGFFNFVRSNFIVLNASNKITFTPTNQYSPVAESVTHQIRFDNAVSYGFLIYNVSVVNSLSFSTLQHHRASIESALSFLGFFHSAAITLFETVSDTISFTQQVVVDKGYGLIGNLTLESVLDYDIIRTKLTASDINFVSNANVYKMDKTFSMFPEIVPPAPEI